MTAPTSARPMPRRWCSSSTTTAICAVRASPISAYCAIAMMRPSSSRAATASHFVWSASISRAISCSLRYGLAEWKRRIRDCSLMRRNISATAAASPAWRRRAGSALISSIAPHLVMSRECRRRERLSSAERMTCTPVWPATYNPTMPTALVGYDVVKSFHIMAVVAGYGLPLAYPFLLPYLRRRHPGAMAGVHDVQHLLNQRLTGPMTILILAFGAWMASKHDLWDQVWFIVPIAILVVIGALGGAVVVPATARLAELAREDLNGAEYAQVYRRYMTAEIVLGVLVLVAT